MKHSLANKPKVWVGFDNRLFSLDVAASVENDLYGTIDEIAGYHGHESTITTINQLVTGIRAINPYTYHDIQRKETQPI